MSTYSGTPFTVNKPAAEISEKFSNLTSLRPLLDKHEAELKDHVGNIQIDTDSIAFDAKPLGQVKFKVVENTPQGVTMDAQGTPVPLKLKLKLDEKTPDTTEATCSVDVEIPMMLRGMIAPQIKKMTDMLTGVMEKALNSAQ
ncbi:MAG: hypothetical protein LUD17_08535 [Bacteroidales bacterium]|nr:hypothetical protein [Bacteroidales bacterium]